MKLRYDSLGLVKSSTPSRFDQHILNARNEDGNGAVDYLGQDFLFEIIRMMELLLLYLVLPTRQVPLDWRRESSIREEETVTDSAPALINPTPISG